LKRTWTFLCHDIRSVSTGDDGTNADRRRLSGSPSRSYGVIRIRTVFGACSRLCPGNEAERACGWMYAVEAAGVGAVTTFSGGRVDPGREAERVCG
jgi:hypothetical protein